MVVVPQIHCLPSRSPLVGSRQAAYEAANAAELKKALGTTDNGCEKGNCSCRLFCYLWS